MYCHDSWDWNGITVFGIRSLPTLVQKHLRLTPPVGISAAVCRVLTECSPDIIHIQSHFLPHAVLTEAKRLKIPVIGTNHFVPEKVRSTAARV